MTDRQYRAWLDFLYRKELEDMNNPSVTDHYLMQIAYCVERANTRIRSPQSIKFDSFRLKFRRKGSQSALDKLPLETRTTLTKAAWIARVGGKVTEIKVPKDPDSMGS